MTSRWFRVGMVSALAVVIACSSDDDGSSVDENGPSSGGAFGTGGGFGTGGAAGTAATAGTAAVGGVLGSGGSAGAAASGGDAGFAAVGGSTSTPGFNACTAGSDECVGERYEGETIPLDIYIMFDQSCSMSCPAEQTGAGLCCMGGPNPRIDHVRDAVQTFLGDRASAGIGVGIGYFGYMQAGDTSCDPSDYSDPAVTIGTLPSNLDPLLDSLWSVEPTGETPTGAAIRGACTYAAQWKEINPGHTVVVLLVTDGYPEAPVTSMNGGCTPSIGDAVQAASTCSGYDPPLPIYVLGIGYQLDNLEQIAIAGGTEQAYLVQGGDVSAQVLAALNEIRGLAQIPCELQLPPAPAGETLNLSQVNVGYCSAGGDSRLFYYVDTPDACDPTEGGWFYDNASDPSQIMLCAATCETVTAPGGSLFMSVGCDTVISIQ